jgi:signal transduction histidine kinase
MKTDAINMEIADYALEMIIACRDDGSIIYANKKARMELGYGEDAKGHNVYSVFPAFLDESGSPKKMKDLATGEPKDIIAYRVNKTLFHCRAVVFQSDPDIYVILGLNVSEEEFLRREISNAGEEVQEADKVKTEFVANVTHELRTPVNGILGSTRDLLSVVTDSEQVKKLTLIEKSCENMNNIISSILDFSKLSAGKFTLEQREFNFRDMIDYVKESHSSRINEKGLDFFVSISPEVPDVIIGDELRIVQILNNLLSNATKFTSVGKIALEIFKTARVGKKVELFFIVVDSGIGIEKADLSKLFKSFSQVDASISRNFGGTGLGLNITKQLVEMMGGVIECESEKNKGSTFSFSIWVEVPTEDEEEEEEFEDESGELEAFAEAADIIPEDSEEEHEEGVKAFGNDENISEIEKRLSKLILCVEMQNWERAEMFADSVKQLVESAPKEIRTATLHLKMDVQKENYDKVVDDYGQLLKYLGDYKEG